MYFLIFSSTQHEVRQLFSKLAVGTSVFKYSVLKYLKATGISFHKALNCVFVKLILTIYFKFF